MIGSEGGGGRVVAPSAATVRVRLMICVTEDAKMLAPYGFGVSMSRRDLFAFPLPYTLLWCYKAPQVIHRPLQNIKLLSSSSSSSARRAI